ncbi:hypothetical protein TI39_contig1049g00001 [Zymoseptoria brevis]|uniref:GA4 desaturase family protein n=1 Tax=Zymoseptoria brevis TaxID=1047168 RepID=A0A0F4GHW7_9PEZI|nr:hypothetical protein TI39_contig1049g00001 [Zymoseptoria brevis]
MSISAYDRALYTLPGNKSLKDEKVVLHDFRTAKDVAHGLEGLDKQGFTYVKHKSSVTYDDWLKDGVVEDVYCQELKELILNATGAKDALIYCVAFRRRLAIDRGIEEVDLRGAPMDQAVGCLPRDRCLIAGRDGFSPEPSRQVHIDISRQGMFDTLRSCRKDITEKAKSILEAVEKGEPLPRHAAFGVWRPLKTVRRDPMAVCDSRTNDKSELVPVDFRALSETTDSADYVMHTLMPLPPKKPEQQKWYWLPEQTPDDVLIFKFCDSAAAEDESISDGVLHTSPIVEGSEDEEVRESVEARIYVFW